MNKNVEKIRDIKNIKENLRTEKKKFSIKNYIKQKEIENRKKIRHKKKYNRISRLAYIMKTGKTLDFTAMEEMDIAFLKVWKQYQYLRFLDIYLRLNLNRLIENGKLTEKDLDNKFLQDIFKLLKISKELQKEYTKYMFNITYVIMSSVIKNKFWKYQKYRKILINRFIDTALENIKKLKFNEEKARPSIYFYQSFWLAGLSLIKEIEKLKEREVRLSQLYQGESEEIYERFNDRGNILISDYQEFMEDHILEDKLLDLDSESILTIEELELKEKEEIYHNNEVNTDITNIEIKNKDLYLQHHHSNIVNELIDYDTIDKETIEEIREQAISVIRKLLNKLNIDVDFLYSVVSEIDNSNRKSVDLRNNTKVNKRIEIVKELLLGKSRQRNKDKENVLNQFKKLLSDKDLEIIEKYLKIRELGLI